MRNKEYTPRQIAKILKEFESGKTIAAITEEYGVNSALFYKWRNDYSGISTVNLDRLKELEDENRRLKEMYAALALDYHVAKEIIEKKN